MTVAVPVEPTWFSLGEILETAQPSEAAAGRYLLDLLALVRNLRSLGLGFAVTPRLRTVLKESVAMAMALGPADSYDATVWSVIQDGVCGVFEDRELSTVWLDGVSAHPRAQGLSSSVTYRLWDAILFAATEKRIPGAILKHGQLTIFRDASARAELRTTANVRSASFRVHSVCKDLADDVTVCLWRLAGKCGTPVQTYYVRSGKPHHSMWGTGVRGQADLESRTGGEVLRAWRETGLLRHLRLRKFAICSPRNPARILVNSAQTGAAEDTVFCELHATGDRSNGQGLVATVPPGAGRLLASAFPKGMTEKDLTDLKEVASALYGRVT